MKIQVITDTYAPDINGVAMTLGRLCEGLRQRGHEVAITHTAASCSAGDERVFSLPLLGYPGVRLGLPKPFKMRMRWKHQPPDAIYVATESPLGKSAINAAKALGIPVITGFHTNFDQYMEPYRLGGLKPLAMRYLKRFHRLANCTLVPTLEVKRRLTEEGFSNVYCMGRGVDTQLYSPSHRCDELRQSWGASPQSPVAIIVGRVAAEKNFALGIRAFKALRDLHPTVQCVIVGDGPLRKQLQEEHPWIIFCGMREGSDLARHYASADVLLFPSETETFGNVLLEGMASGLLTVSYDYAAAATHINDGINGLKAPKSDATSFVESAIRAITHEQSQAIREAARKTAESLSWEQVIQEFEGNFSRITSSQPPAKTAEPLPRKNKHARKLSCRTVIMSDVHLGTYDSKAKEAVHFLKRLRCEKLILNGDIIDAWALRRGGKWGKHHSRFIRKVLKMADKDGTEVVYLRGNHDDILERFLPLAFGKIRVAKEHLHRTKDGKVYLVIHGDGFDRISSRHRWLAVAGSVGYDFLLCVNRQYNRWRSWRGKEYYSISKQVKARVKSAVSFVDRFEFLLQQLAEHRGCDGVICGHIHTPQDRYVGNCHYLNSGDWVESLTAIIEHHDGKMELVSYEDFIAEKTERQMTAYPTKETAHSSAC